MAVTFAQIEPTTRCNFSCGFCVGRHMAQGDLAWEHFEAFLAAHPALAHVELQGEGEPMLHPRFFDMVAACRTRGIKVSIITNGSLLGAERVERLIESGVATVHVSLETSDPERFQAIRGGLFAKVEAGLRLLMQRRRSLAAATPKVGFAVTLLRGTIDGFDDIAELYRELGLDGGIGVQPLQRMPDYAGAYDQAMMQQLLPREFAPRIAAIRRRAADAEARGLDTFYAALFAGFRPDRDGCPWLERGAYLGIGGAISACCFVKRPGLAFGTLGADGSDAIAARRSAANAQLLGGSVPDACRGCGTATAIVAASQPHEAGLITSRRLATGAPRPF